MINTKRIGLRVISGLFLFATLLICTNAYAWFFFFYVPGSITSKIGDAITGAKGEQCVGEKAKVGDVIRSPAGNTAKIISLSGTSSRCKNPDLPIRAELEFTYSFSSKAGIDIPEGYQQKPLTDINRFQGTLVKAENSSNKTGFIVFARNRGDVSDPAALMQGIAEKMSTTLDEVVTSNDEEMQINGMNAWRFELTGKTKQGIFRKKYTYMVTALEGDKEVVVVNAWAPADTYKEEKAGLKKLSEGVIGIKTNSGSISHPPQAGNAPSAVPVTSEPPKDSPIPVTTQQPGSGQRPEETGH